MSVSTTAPTASALREFAAKKGIDVGARGPVPQHVKDAYAAAEAAKAKRRNRR